MKSFAQRQGKTGRAAFNKAKPRKMIFLSYPDDEPGSPPYSEMSEGQFDAYLMRRADRAWKQPTKALPSRPTPEAKERLARDFAHTLFLLGGAQPDELDFMYGVEPDGSRTAALEKIIGKQFYYCSPGYRFALNSDLMEMIVTDCHAMGIVGERNLICAIYLIATSRLLPKPLAGIVQGTSSSGKSFTLRQVSKLIPPEAVLNATRITPQALYHCESLDHKFIIGGERSRKQDDDTADATGALRQLLSEGRISKLMPEKVEGKYESRLVEQVGAIAYIETTTLKPGAIFNEDLNRCLFLKTDESPKHTAEILLETARRYEPDTKVVDLSGIIEKHHQFQSLLKKEVIVIPYASKVLSHIPSKNVKARRVGQQVLSMIEAVTFLHQHQRERDDSGRLVATKQDYEIAAEILRQPLGESLGVKVSPAKFYEKLAAAFPERKEFKIDEARKLSDASERTIRNWLKELSEHNCIALVKAAKGRTPAVWRMTANDPAFSVLPDVSEVDM